jgi:hypothetical protein
LTWLYAYDIYFLYRKKRLKKIIIPLSITVLFFSHLIGLSKEQNSIKQIPEFSGKNAYDYLVKQCDFGPRNPGSAGHRLCRDYLITTLQQFADKVSTQPFILSYGSPPKQAKCTNIIARFQPEKSSRILLCAHWDTRPWADKDPDPKNRDKPILGANDGASGVAVLLEIAKIIHNNKPKMGIDIVLFDGEDAGVGGSSKDWIQGSSFFAKNLGPKDRPLFGILIDMIGDADLDVYKEANSWRYARPVVEKIWKKAAELNISNFKPEVKYSVLDDHIPLLEAGIPCVDLIDFDYKYWHTIEDTQDKCSSKSLGNIGRLLVNIIYSYE